MSLTPEQVKELKVQLYSQVENLPESQRKAAQAQIDSMSSEAIEAMLKQQQEKGPQKDEEQKSIFRAIVSGEVSSIKTDENNSAIAILDINPISEGHTLIIPKKPVSLTQSIPNSVFSLAKRVSKKIMIKLKAKSTELQTEEKLGEKIVHVIPIYNSPLGLDSPRQKLQKEVLEKIGSLLRVLKKQKVTQIKKPKVKDQVNKILRLPRRIP